MDLDSDSDSDLEFLAGHGSPQSNAPTPAATGAATGAAPQATPSTKNRAANSSSSSAGSSTATADLQAELERLRRDMWEKLGENVILRSQLESNASTHARELGNLINQQTKAKEELHKELERQKQEIERQRVQFQFLQAELRSHPGGAGGAGGASATALRMPSDSGVQRQIGANGPLASPSKRRAAAAAAAFSDGFVLKKQRILPSLDASQSKSQFAGPVNERLTQAVDKPNTQDIDLPALLALIAAHRAPGQSATTLELLYTHKLPTGMSVGHRVSEFSSFAELVDTMIDLIKSVSAGEDDCMSLLLALLYAFTTRRLPLEQSHKRALSSTLCTKLTEWLKPLNPLPPFASLLPPFSLPLVDLRLLTCVLYTLDVLASLDWEFTVPHELSRRLLTCSYVPQIVSKAVNVLCLQPKSMTPELAKLINPMVGITPSIELLFSGLVDAPSLSVAQLCNEQARSQSTCSLAPSLDRMAELRELAEQLAESWTETFQSACIQLAQTLQYDREPPIPMFPQILTILTGHIDCPFPAESRIIRETVLYFWCLEPARLRDELNEDELAELEVCIAKLVHAATEPSEPVNHGRELLQALAVGADSDLVFEAFEPITREHRRLIGQGSPSSMSTGP